MKIISDKRASIIRLIFRQMCLSRSTEASMNFQIVVALACLLDIRMSLICTSSRICLGTKLLNTLVLAAKVMMSSVQVRPKARFTVAEGNFARFS